MHRQEGDHLPFRRDLFQTEPLTHEFYLMKQFGIQFDTNTQPQLVVLNWSNSMRLYQNYFDRGCLPFIGYVTTVHHPLKSFSTFIPEYNTIFMTQEKRDEKIRLLTHAYYLEQHPSLLGIPRKLNIDMDPVSRSVENTPKFQQELETDLEHFLAHHAMVEGISAWIVDSLHIRKEVDVRSTRYRTYRAPVDSGALTINSTDSDGTRQYEQWRDEYMQLRSNIFAAAAMAGNGDELARGYIGQTVSDIRMGIHNDALGLLGYQFVHFVIHEQKKQQLRVSEILPRIIQQSPVTLMELEHPNIFLER